MTNPFRSSRLLYRAIDPTSPADTDFFAHVQRDPIAYANSNYSLLCPVSRADCDAKLKRDLDEHLLMVMVCLPRVDGAGVGGVGVVKEEGGEERKEEREGPEDMPVGVLTLSLTGSSARTVHHRSAMIGIDIVKEHQGKGYGTEAIEWALNWGFRMAGLHRIEIDAWSYNEGACKLYQRIGFRLEGRKKEAVWFDGGWHDILCMAMLEGEWKARGKDGV